MFGIGKLDFHDGRHCCISLFKQHTTIHQVVENEWAHDSLLSQNAPWLLIRGMYNSRLFDANYSPFPMKTVRN